MAKESSFDVVSTVDMQEVDNAYGQAKREIAQRYDLKDSGAEITLDKGGRKLTVAAPAEFVAKTGYRRHRQQAHQARRRPFRCEMGRHRACRWSERSSHCRDYRRHRPRKPRAKSRRTFVARSSSAKSLLRATSCAFLRLRATRCKKLLPF